MQTWSRCSLRTGTDLAAPWMESAGRVTPERGSWRELPKLLWLRHRHTARPVLFAGRWRLERGQSLPHVHWPDQGVPSEAPMWSPLWGSFPGVQELGSSPPTPREPCVCPSPEAGPDGSRARQGSPCPRGLPFHALQRGGSCRTTTIPGPCGAQPRVSTRAKNTLTAVGGHQSSTGQETNPRD